MPPLPGLSGSFAFVAMLPCKSAYCSGKVVAAVIKAGARFSFAVARKPAVDAIATIPDEQYTPVQSSILIPVP